ncbi:transposase [Streptomyces sp. NPDC001312]|uniref:transposase n=1 Tax=Streptomyces sp. NPDC001312 TaxID=3364561 RepID=UPI00367F6294
MTAPDSLPLHALAKDNLASASPDLLRAMIKTFADALMSAEADALCNAEYGQVSDERVNHRNGYRPREWDTRAGTVELAVPKLRSGSYFPHWLLERRRRAKQALISVVATAYLLGVSTRRVNLLSQVPKSAQPWVATLLRTVFEQPDTDAVKAQMRHVLDALEAKFPKAAAHLDAAQHDLLAFTAFPREIWRQIWSNNPQERLNKEIRRRTDVVGIFPARTAVIRLVGAVLAEQNDEWTEARRYMGRDLLAKARLHPIESETDETVLPTELTA